MRSVHRCLAHLAGLIVLSMGTVVRAAPPGEGWELIFADEFNGTSVDTMKWNHHYVWGRTHNHRAFMSETQAIVRDGVLNLQAVAKRHPDAPDGIMWKEFGGWQSLDYTAAAINSSGKFHFTGGYVEARMKLSDVRGSWPAFWTHQERWPPEIDIMEFPRSDENKANQRWVNYHFRNEARRHTSYGWQDTGPDLTKDFHHFGVMWMPEVMTFYFDDIAGREIKDARAIGQSRRMYFILNHAVGGWARKPDPDTSFPADYLTDWVRVWQKRSEGAGKTSKWKLPGGGAWDDAASWDGIIPMIGGQRVEFRSADDAATTPAQVKWSGSRPVGEVAFTSRAAFTLGDDGAGLQMIGAGGAANATIEATETCRADQTIKARVELHNDTDVRNNMPAHNLVFSGAVIGDGGLTIGGPGIVTLANENTYRGATAVRTGTLLVSGSHTGGWAYEVAAGATLGGSGRIDPAGENVITVGGRLAPGDAEVGLLLVGSADGPDDVVFTRGSQLRIKVGEEDAADRLIVHGKLDLGDDAVELSILSLRGGFDGRPYTIANFTPRTLGGKKFRAVVLDGTPQSDPEKRMSNGYRVVYDDVGGIIRLVKAE